MGGILTVPTVSLPKQAVLNSETLEHLLAMENRFGILPRQWYSTEQRKRQCRRRRISTLDLNYIFFLDQNSRNCQAKMKQRKDHKQQGYKVLIDSIFHS